MALNDAAQSISGGDLNIRLESSETDEIGDLARAFNTMADNLKTITVSRSVLLQEIKERRAAETALMESRKQLAQSQKLESIGHLAGGIAHDFNNILTGLLGSVSFLLDDTEADDPRRADILDIKSAGIRAANLTRQLLAFSRKQLLQPEVLDLNTIMNDFNKFLTRTVKENIELKLQFDTPTTTIRADRTQLETVILNLVVNAVHAMPKGGTLRLTTDKTVLSTVRTEGNEEIPPGNYITLTVTDTGCGMDQKTVSLAFEPFFTTKGRAKGTGLGLSMVYGIIKQSGGYITLHSKPGRGTTFTIYLPETTKPTEVRDSKLPETGEMTGSEALLVADDDVHVRKITVRLLTRLGYKVLEADDGNSALEIIRKSSQKVDMLITDVIMPKMSGAELWEAAQSIQKDLKFLFISGYSDTHLGDHGDLPKDTPFIAKPFDSQALSLKVRKILDS